MSCTYWHQPGTDCPGWHWHPHFDESLRHAQDEWDEGQRRWEESGNDEDALKHPEYTYADWSGDPTFYRPEWPEGTPLGYCYYETVSEGTPKSPAFATQTELADWLVQNEGMSPEGAARFVEIGWAPSGMSSPATGFVTGMQAVDRGLIGGTA